MARKILLADDSVTAQNMGRKILADAGYDVVTVNNGSAALKKVSEIKPDLIVLDVYMPGFSGLEACQRLKDAEETAHIPVLLTVGKLEPFKPEEARRVRADGHIVKPFEASELLTAITRLEDAMVPPQTAGSRFDGSGRKSDIKPGTDNGWKTRLGFPSKKKKEEKEEAEDFTAGTFRDFRKTKSKTIAAKAAPFKDPDLVPDIPRDITPEELDALSAVAAKLDGPRAAAEEAAANATPIVTATVPSVAAGTEVVAVDTKPAEKMEAEIPAAPVKAVAADAPAFTVEDVGEVEIPVEHMELATDAAVVETRQPGSDPAAGQPAEVEHREKQHAETPHSESQVSETKVSQNQPAEAPAVSAVVVDTALLAQEAAPVDRNDEPMFAALPSAAETALQETAEAKPVEVFAVTNSETPETTETIATTGAGAAAAKALESQFEVSQTQIASVAEAPAEMAAQPVTEGANLQQMMAAEEPVPSDEELAQALRLLTPATAQLDVSSSQGPIPSPGTLAAAGQLLAEEVARSTGSGSRWVAEPVALSPEEAAISLEAEMFRTFADMHAATLGSEMEPAKLMAVSAIAAAVENRLAAVEMATSAKASSELATELSAAAQPAGEHNSGDASEQVSEHVSNQNSNDGSDQRGSETTSVETSAGSAATPALVPVEAGAGMGNETGKLGESAPVINLNIAPAEAEHLAPEKPAAEATDSAEKLAEEAPVEEFPAATFADAIGQNVADQDAVEKSVVSQSEVTRNEFDAVVERDEAPAGGTTADATAEQSWGSSSQGEGQEAMGKDKDKEKDGKSKKTNWHQIHSAPASAAAKGDLVEAAKEAEPAAEETPKAMAAAAASAPASAPDASTIASIVDSVMADLRPKIVEEIAKRLAGK
ncbi:MAG: response regulator [Terriglobales bacterium]